MASSARTWTGGGDFSIRVKAKDTIGSESDWSDPHVFSIENSAPNTPDLTGKRKGKAGISYLYSAVSVDPDDNPISYWFDWGDGTNTGWIGLYPSATMVNASHVWNTQGDYTIKVKAKDCYDVESTWATLDVSMPLHKQVEKRMPLFNQLFTHFSWLYMLLQNHLGSTDETTKTSNYIEFSILKSHR